MAELIGQRKRRGPLTDLQARRRRNPLIGRRVFLPTRKAKESDKEKNANRNSHFGSTSILGLSGPPHGDASTTDITTLIRKSRESRSPHSSRVRLLDNHRDPKIPRILAFEIKFHVAGKPCGLVHSSDSNKITQYRDML